MALNPRKCRFKGFLASNLENVGLKFEGGFSTESGAKPRTCRFKVQTGASAPNPCKCRFKGVLEPSLPFEIAFHSKWLRNNPQRAPNPPQISVIDVVVAITGQTPSNSAVAFKRLQHDHTEVTAYCSDFNELWRRILVNVALKAFWSQASKMLF